MTTIPENTCDATMGMIAFLVGSPAFGSFHFVCRSIDPGIAISTTENLMCNGEQNFGIDYLQQFPTIIQCTCPDLVPVPATSQVRRYGECNSQFADFVRLSLPSRFYDQN